MKKHEIGDQGHVSSYRWAPGPGRRCRLENIFQPFLETPDFKGTQNGVRDNCNRSQNVYVQFHPTVSLCCTS